jgi:hypothetical protein
MPYLNMKVKVVPWNNLYPLMWMLFICKIVFKIKYLFFPILIISNKNF